MAPLFADNLLRDICQLLNDTSNCDVIIEVGNDREHFKAHSLILGARSPYLKTTLTSNLVKKDNDKIIFTMPNISPKVFGKIINQFTKNDFNELESRLKDFIPFMRFFSITKDQYTLGVLPYEYILPDSLRNELKEFFESNEKISPPKNFRLPRIPITQTVPDSVLINNKHLALLASWIDSKDNDGISFNISRNIYEFNLLLRGSRDGKTIREFHELCINKGPTLVIIKVKDSLQIIGGYNPESWNLEIGLKYNEDAFICSLGGGDKKFGIVLSRAKYNEMSIRNAPNLAIGFMDLGWFEGRYNHLYFEKRIMDSNYKEFIQDYEVFQVCKKSV
ncbi:2625_t:CDS:2 [Funneliformis geosporum]|nr:2625_t:CDS:2 [Funneliformis geosporum]